MKFKIWRYEKMFNKQHEKMAKLVNNRISGSNYLKVITFLHGYLENHPR